MQGEQAVWDNMLTWLSTTTSKPAVQECGVALLAVLADRGLAANLQLRSPQLWSLPVLQQGSLAAPSAHLICAAFAQGACVAVELLWLSYSAKGLHAPYLSATFASCYKWLDGKIGGGMGCKASKSGSKVFRSCTQGSFALVSVLSCWS